MRLTQILLKQHIGRQIRKFWYIQGKRTPMETLTEKKLAARGIQICDADDVVKIFPKLSFDFSTVKPLCEKLQELDNTHPDWHDRPCLIYKDNDLLTLGLTQAQNLTKTILFENQLPESMDSQIKDVPMNYHELAEKIIKTSVIYDSHQERLPKIKDPKRPAFNFPRVLGITAVRRASNLSKKLIQLCECISGPEISNTRSIIDNAFISLPFEKEFDLCKFDLTMDMMLMSEKPLPPVREVSEEYCDSFEFPDLHPVHCTVGLGEENIYKLDNLYPLTSGYHKNNVHTIFVSYDKTKTKHKTELEFDPTQVPAAAFLKSFTAAASSARHKFGVDIKDLPEPIIVQCIYSDGKGFEFSIYQLNTLNIDGTSGLKNYYWTMPRIDLYHVGDYVDGIPTLQGYNPQVLERMLAFYKNN